MGQNKKTDYFERGLAQLINADKCGLFCIDSMMTEFADDIEHIRLALRDLDIHVSHLDTYYFWLWRSDDWSASWLGIDSDSILEYADRLIEHGLDLERKEHLTDQQLQHARAALRHIARTCINDPDVAQFACHAAEGLAFAPPQDYDESSQFQVTQKDDDGRQVED